MNDANNEIDMKVTRKEFVDAFKQDELDRLKEEHAAVGYVTNDEIAEHRRAQLYPSANVMAGQLLYAAPQYAQAIETAAIMRAMKVVDGWASTASEYGFDGDMEQFMRVKADIEALIPQDGRTQLEELLSKFAEALLIEINGNYGTAHVSDGPLWHVIVKRAIHAIVTNLIGDK